jgi:uroporphyrinogen decarboxylase
MPDPSAAKERIEAVFRFERPDRVPIYSWLCNDAIIEHFSGRALTPENAAEVVPQAMRGCLDLVQKTDSGALFLPEREREETDRFGFTRRYARWTNWVIGRPFADGDTAAMATFMREDIERFRTWSSAEAAQVISRVDQLQQQLGTDALVAGRTFIITGPGSYYRDGLDNFAYFRADYPHLATEWLQARHQRSLRMIDCLADGERYPVEIVSGDLAYKGGMLFSPLWLRDSGWFHLLSEIVDAFHQKGVKVIYHSDGNLMSILHDLVATGIDGLNPIEVAAGMDLARLREGLGARLVLVGGLPYHTLICGRPDEVRRATEECLRVASLGYIIGSSTEEFSNDVPLMNYLAMLETVRAWHP